MLRTKHGALLTLILILSAILCGILAYGSDALHATITVIRFS